MDAIADRQTELDGQAVSDEPLTAPRTDEAGAGEGRSPFLTLATGFAQARIDSPEV
jgi:hypothetical protein